MAKLKRRLNISPVQPADQNTTEDNNDIINNVKEQLGISEKDFKESEETFTEKESETIDLNDKTKSENFATIDYNSPKYIEELVSATTDKVEDKNSVSDNGNKNGKNEFSGKTAKEIEDSMSSESDFSKKTPEDFYEIAEIVVFLIDMLASSGLKMFAKDTKDSEYSLNEKKKKILTKMLASILIKHQSRMKVEVMFIIALICMYVMPFWAAKQRRDKIKQLEKDLLAKKEAEEMAGFYSATPSDIQEKKDQVVAEAAEIIEETEEEFISNLPMTLKPKKGTGKKK